MQQPPPYATNRRVGCVMWLSIAAIILSGLGLLVDLSQELAWDGRIEQLNALYTDIYSPSTPEAEANQSQPISSVVTESVATVEPLLSASVATSGPSYEAVCDADESNMTDPQIKAFAEQWIGQRFSGWQGWVYDVVDYGDGEYDLHLAMTERGLFWSRDIVIEDIPNDLAISLNVEQPVTLSGRIDRVETSFELVCNPAYVADYTITLDDGTQFVATDPFPVGVQVSQSSETPSTPTPLPTWTPVPAPVVPKDARDSLFVHGNASPQLPTGEQGVVSVIAVGKIKTSEFSSYSIVPVVIRNNVGTYVTRIGVSATARDANGAIIASGGEQGGLVPNLVQPGEIAFGYLYFADVKLPDNTRFEFQADYSPPGDSIEEFETNRDLEVTEANIVENRLVGLLRNQYSEVITGPLGIEAVCFDASNQFLAHYDGYSDQDTVSVGATVSFQLDLEEDICPVYLVAGGGYTE